MRVWWVLSMVGCGGGEAPPGPVEDEATTSCEAGWREDAGVCVPEACGAGPYGSVEAEVWVDAAAPGGGDGSREAPFPDIDSAVGASPGGVVGVAAGTYAWTPLLSTEHAGLEVWGRCSALVTVDLADAPEGRAAVSIGGEGDTTFGLHGLTLVDAPTVALDVTEAQLVASDLVVARAVGVGVAALSGGDLVFTDVHVTSTAFDRGEVYGFGVYAYGGDLSCEGCSFTDNANGGVYVNGRGASATLSGGEVAGTGWPSGAHDAWALAVSGGGRLVADGVSVHDNANVGVWVGTGTVELEDVGVLGTTPGVDPENWAAGVYVDGGAATLTRVTVGGTRADHDDVAGIAAEGGSLDLTEVVIPDSTFRALFASGTEVDLDQLEVSGTIAPSGTPASAPISLVSDTHARMSGLVLHDNAGGGFFVASPGTTLALAASTISGPTDTGALGLWGLDGALLTLEDLTLSDVAGLGMGFYSGATATLTGVEIVGLSGAGAVGLVVQDGASVAAEGVSVHDVDGHGVLVYGGVLAVSGLDVWDVWSRGGARGEYGVGVAALGGVEGEDLSVWNVPAVGIAVDGEGAVVTLAGVDVSEVRSVPGESGPTGVVAQRGAVLSVTGLDAHDLAGPGLVAWSDATVSCEECTFTGTAFAGALADGASLSLGGATVRDVGVDPSRGGGVGVAALAGSEVFLTGCEVGAHPLAALWVDDAEHVRVDGSSLVGGAGMPLSDRVTVHGNAVYAHDIGVAGDGGLSGLEIVDSVLSGARVGALLDGASATFTGVSWVDNGLDVQQQACDEHQAPVGVEGASAALCPAWDEVTLSLQFSLRLDAPSAGG